MNEKIEEENKEIKRNNHKNNETKEQIKMKTAKRYELIFDKIKNEDLGIETNKEKGVENEGVTEEDLLQDLVDFTDHFVSCSLKDPSTRQLALDVQQHKHFNLSCRKNGPNCKYQFTLFPS